MRKLKLSTHDDLVETPWMVVKCQLVRGLCRLREPLDVLPSLLDEQRTVRRQVMGRS